MYRLLTLILVSLGLAGCLLPGTTISITSPPDGTTVELNKETPVAVTAGDAVGVTRVELWEAGVVVQTAHSTVPGGQSVFPVTFRWTPRNTGAHVLVAKAYNRESNDRESALAVITLHVQESVPTTTPTATLPIPAVPSTPTRTATPGPSPTPTISPSPTTPPTSTPPPAPSPPTSLTAVGSGNSIQFSWLDSSTVELGFRIYEQGVVAPIIDNIPAHVGTGGVSFEWKNVPCNKIAPFVVRAYNAQGESAPSNAINASTVPCAPSSLSVSAASQTVVNLTFTANGTNEAGYRVYQSGSTTPLGTVTATPGPGQKTGSLGGIPCGTPYIYYVRAFNAAGESTNSNNAEATTLGCNVTVTFTRVNIIHGSDNPVAGCGTVVPRLDCGAGDLWFDFSVNAQAKRWPTSGIIEINDGESRTLPQIVYTFTLTRGELLTVIVNGWDEDSLTANDSLGVVNKAYPGAQNWGAGSHTEKSNCPGGCFEISYTIEVKP